MRINSPKNPKPKVPSAMPERHYPWKRFLLAGALATWATAAGAAVPSAPQGVITAKGYLNIGGGTVVTDLTGNAKFPNNPDVTYYYSYFEWNATGDINTAANNAYGDSYGAQMQGYFYPPATGDYVFWFSSDDGGALYLSTDTDPANKKLIAQEAGWSGVRSWETIGGGSTVEAKNSSTFTGTEWATKDAVYGGAKITLTKGRVYYIEALEKEGGGGDNLAVAVQAPDGSIDSTLPIPGKYLSSIDKNSGPLTITTQPQSQAVKEGDAVTFSIVLDGTPPYTYQWKNNGTAIADATNATYTISRTARADNGVKFSVAVTGAQGSATSADALLTVSSDATAPTIVSASGSASFTYVTVKFSKPLDPVSAAAAANYKVSGGITISAATLGDVPNDNVVTLTTSKQTEGASLTLTVSNVKDIAGNTIAANSTLNFVTAKFSTGMAIYERWNYTADPGSIDILDAAIKDGTMGVPNVSTAVSEFGSAWGVADYYFARVSGFFVPPSTGNYVFFVGSDDQSYLYLSTDDTPANKKLIAKELNWSNQYQFTTSGGSSDLAEKRSDQCTSTEWPNGNTITLQEGKRYYMEALLKEGSGGDGVAATYIKAGDPDPSNDAAGMHLRGNVIATFLDPNGASVKINQQPQSVTVGQNLSAAFSVAATGTSAYGTNVTYQWQSAPKGSSTFTDIAGATSASYSTPLLSLSDSGKQYRVIAQVPTVNATSDVATVTVTSDTAPPVAVSAAAFKGGTRVGVAFNELVDQASAETASNYTVAGSTVTGAALHFGKYVELNLSSAINAAPSVTVKSVKDLAGNAMASATVAAVLSDMTSEDIGDPGVDPIQPGYAVAFGANSYFVTGGGHDIWDNADGFHFVYKQFDGPFDLRARINMNKKGPNTTTTWAKAELMVRESTAPGSRHNSMCSTRADSENANEAQWRDTTDGGCGNSRYLTPIPYPDNWVRLVREDATKNTVTIYSSTDGVTWTSKFSHTTPGAALPSKILVGMAVTSHDNSGNDILSEGMYENFSLTPYTPVLDPQLKISAAGGQVTISWASGTLVSSPTVTGAYAPVAGASSPYKVTPSGSTMFFQIKQ